MTNTNDCFNNDTILMRNDGRTMKSLPIENREDTNENTINCTSHSTETTANKTQDGFITHIHCRWCNETIRDVYIPKLKNGRNGKPYDIVLSYEPCEKCRANWNTMVVFIEVTNTEPYPDCLPIDSDIRRIEGYIDPDENPGEYAERVIEERTEDDGENMRPVQYEKVFFYPTGRYTGVTLDAVRQYFTGDTSAIHNGSVIYLERDMFETAFGDYFK